MTSSTATVAYIEDVGWLLTLGDAGPAGGTAVVLDGVRVTVDAGEPARIVELLVPSSSADGRPVSAAGELTAALVGRRLVNELGRGLAERTVPVETGPAVPAVAALASAELVARERESTSPLGYLDVVIAARDAAAALPAAAAVGRERAWRALPAVLALARAASKWSVIVDSLGNPAKNALNERIVAVGTALRDAALDPSVHEALENLRLLLTDADDTLVDALLAAATGDAGLLSAGALDRDVVFLGAGEPVQVRWSAARDDLRPRLGRLAESAFAGATATGSVPGTLDVRLPLAPGASPAALADAQVRVLTWTGEVLGEGGLTWARSDGRLPVGTCRVNARQPEDAAAVEAHGVVVDIALPGMPVLDRELLRALGRETAWRAGRRAIVAARSGLPGESAAHWRRAAEVLRAIGDDRTAEEADRRAEGALDRAPVPGQRDWFSELRASWASALAGLAGDAADPAGTSSTEDVRAAAAEFGVAFQGSAELAAIHVELAERLATDMQDEAIEELRLALRQEVLRGDEARAASLLRRIRASEKQSDA